MSLLPSRRADPNALDRATGQAAEARAHTEAAIYTHGLRARLLAEVDRLDSNALADALDASLDAEVRLLDHGMRLAGGSPAKAELVASKLEILNRLNNSRIQRRFGGI